MISTIIERRMNHELRRHTARERIRLAFCFVGLAFYIVAAVWSMYRIHGGI